MLNSTLTEQLAKVHPQLHELRVIDVSEEYYKADFKIADVAKELGADWLKLAAVLGLPQAQIDDIQNELEPVDQPLESLVVWTKLKGPLATGARDSLFTNLLMSIKHWFLFSPRPNSKSF